MAGATAATAAGVTASQASTITVNLLSNYISATGGNHLNADLTGDGHPDLTIANASAYKNGSYPFTVAVARVFLNGVFAYALSVGDGGPIGVRLGSQFKTIRYSTVPSHAGSTLTGSIPIFFKDLHINGGAPTKGFLEVTVSTYFAAGSDPKVQLDSFTYSDPPTGRGGAAVPDQGSSLALLAMGAGGVLAFRRWKAAQGRR